MTRAPGQLTGGLGFTAFVLALLASGGPPAHGQVGSAVLELPEPGSGVVIPKDRYLERHSTSLDNYLEWVYGYMLVRAGPIGRDAGVSRWGIGRGRAIALLDGVEFNDPQNGLAPLAYFPVSGLYELRLESNDTAALVRTHSIEGTLSLEEVPAPDEKAHTFIELSKGDRDLRQRRVRFASKRARVALDIGYDEVLNDGYEFDASGTIGTGNPDFGKSQSRHISMRVRGEFDDAARYEVGFRRYTASSEGDLQSASNEQRRSGHLATIRASAGRIDFTLFERGFDVIDPDSNTVNSTRAAYATFHAVRVRETDMLVKVGIEDIASEQRVGGVRTASGLRKIAASVEGGGRIASVLGLRAHAGLDGYLGRSTGWGVGGEVDYVAGGHRISLGLRRTYRMPALGELFLPAHTEDGFTIAGNSNVGDEHSWEASAGVLSRIGIMTNELRVSAIRVQDPIAFLPTSVGNELWRVAANGPSGSMLVVEDRVGVEGNVSGLDVVVDGGVVWTDGDREGFFQSSPEVRTAWSAGVGRDFFNSTSALSLAADYQYTAERRDYQGVNLESYGVLNAYLELRLIDARLYLSWMNALDESYETLGGYLMTPRTFVYGILWTLYD